MHYKRPPRYKPNITINPLYYSPGEYNQKQECVRETRREKERESSERNTNWVLILIQNRTGRTAKVPIFAAQFVSAFSLSLFLRRFRCFSATLIVMLRSFLFLIFCFGYFKCPPFIIAYMDRVYCRLMLVFSVGRSLLRLFFV